MTKIILCKCPDTGQDKLYGNLRRLANSYGKPHKGYRCTVCGKDHVDHTKVKS